MDMKTLLAELPMGDEDRASVMALFEKHPEAVRAAETKLSSFASGIETERADLESKRQALEAEWEALKGYRGADAKVVGELETRVEKLASQVAVGEQRIKRLATDAGIDPEPYLKDLTVAAPVKNETTVSSPMDSTEIMQKAGGMAWNAAKTSALLFDIAQEHQALFGKPLTNTSDLLDKTMELARRTNNPNVSPRDVWEREYKVADRRAEIQEVEVQRRITEAVEQAKTKVRDEMSLKVSDTPPADATRPRSPVFDALKDTTSPVTVQGVSESVSAAVLDFRKRRAS